MYSCYSNPVCDSLSQQKPKGKNMTILSCTNPNCPCRIRGKIINYLKKLGVKNIGEETVYSLSRCGFLNDITDLYKLKKHYNELIELPGYDTISVQTIINEIDRCRRISAPTFMGAIGIESIGKMTFGKVLEKFTIEDLLEFSEDGYLQISKLISVRGIKETQAKKILTGVHENRKLIRKLVENCLDIYYPDPEKEDGKFTAVFHKFRSDSLAELILSYGGVIKDNLSRKTNMLIVPNGFRDEDTSKLKKAREWGVPILERNEVEPRLKQVLGNKKK